MSAIHSSGGVPTGMHFLHEPFGSEAPKMVTSVASTIIYPVPNPSNATFGLRFQLPEDSDVWVSIYDARGRQVGFAELGTLPTGDHS